MSHSSWRRTGLRSGLAALGVVLLFVPACSTKHDGVLLPAIPPSGVGEQNSADRLLMWVGCPEVAAMDDAALDTWVGRGVDGFICVAGHVMGGPNAFTADVANVPSAPAYNLERTLRDSRIAERAAAKGMSLYLSFYLLNPTNTATPLANWFDDDAWNSQVLPALRERAGMAQKLGFRGLSFDQELYPQANGAKTATWAWSFPGNSHSEGETRAKVRDRGRDAMKAMVDAFPNLEVAAYGTQLPDTWEETVQREQNNLEHVFRDVVMIDFWDGLSGTEGYSVIRLFNAIFYKIPGVSGASWDAALQQEYSELYSLLSRRFSNWAYAAPRFEESPFSWIDNGAGSAFEKARSPAHVQEQLDAFNRWGMGRTFANFAFDALGSFDYTPYVPAMQAASTPRVVSDQPPTLRVTTPTTQSGFTASGSQLTLEGVATDPYAIRYLSWNADNGASGMAQLTWERGEGSVANGYRNPQMRWTATVPLNPGPNTVQLTAVDIKNLSTTTSVTVTR